MTFAPYLSRRGARIEPALDRYRLPGIRIGGRRRRDALQPAGPAASAAPAAGARRRRSRRLPGARAPKAARALRHAGRVRHRDDPHLLAHPRRPAGDGRRCAAAGPADARMSSTAMAWRFSPAMGCRPKRLRCSRASRRPDPPDRRCPQAARARVVAAAAGAAGMVGGQAIDLAPR